MTYIGVYTDDLMLIREVLHTVYEKACATSENYPEGVYVRYVMWFRVAVNYTSKDYTLNLPENVLILQGEKTLKSPGVTIWKE